ncbi:hypothetical protein LINPERHAP1_LOCUS54, partial [Linum perenne]
PTSPIHITNPHRKSTSPIHITNPHRKSTSQINTHYGRTASLTDHPTCNNKSKGVIMSQGLGSPSCSSLGRPHIGRAILLQPTFHNHI